MNVLLINPSQTGIYGKFTPPDHPPIGLAYIASMLEKHGHAVSIIDIDSDKITDDQLKSIISDRNITLVGIMALTPTFLSALRTARVVKQNTDVRVVLGGIHPSGNPSECLSKNEVDYVVIGEGEYVMLELVNAIEKGSKLSNVKGLGYKDNNGLKINERRHLIADLDDLPFPAMHLFKNTRYTYPDALMHPAFPIMTSRGCPGKCTFCNSKSIFTNKFRARSPKKVVDEIEQIIKRYQAKEIHIWDDNFATLRSRVFAIRDEMKRRNIKINLSFPNGIRADFLNDDILQALKDMGTYSIALGIESCDETVLKKAKKNIDVEKVKHVVLTAKKYGIETWGFFIFGLPGDTKESIQKTIQFAIDLDLDVAKFHILKPYPGSEVYDILAQDDLIDDFDYSRYGIHDNPVHHLEHLTAEDMINLQREAYKRFYLRPIAIYHQLRRIHSLTRLKLNIMVGFALFKKIFREN